MRTRKQGKCQNVLLDQLRDYWLIQNPEILKDKELSKYSNELHKGCCLGFSIERAGMRVTGNLGEWRKIRNAVATWDGRAKSLEQESKISFEGYNKPITLNTLFNRKANNVFFNQVDASFPYLNNCYQESFLSPGDHFMLQKGEETFYIKDHYVVPGYFEQNDLIKLLENSAEILENHICLVHSPTHTCELSFENGCFNFFDPNYKDGDAHSFDSLETLTEEIISVLGNNLCIELACFSKLKETPFPYYDVLLTEHPERLIQDQGLFMFYRNLNLVPPLLNHLRGGFNHNITDAVSLTIEQATLQGHADAIKALCEKGANPNQVRDGSTLLMDTTKDDNLDAVIALLNAGANPNTRTSIAVSTILDLAHKKGRRKEVETFIRQQHQHLPPETMPYTALDLAILCGHSDIVKVLSDRTLLDCNIIEKQYQFALAMNHKEVAEILLNKMLTRQKEETLKKRERPNQFIPQDKRSPKKRDRPNFMTPHQDVPIRNLKHPRLDQGAPQKEEPPQKRSKSF